jgi:hypothetical protein
MSGQTSSSKLAVRTITLYFTQEELEQINALAGSYPLVAFCHDATLNYQNKPRSKSRLNKVLRNSSSFCVLVGGILLASNTQWSKYGFIFLALSSSQFLVASILSEEWEMVVYFGGIFIFVDSLGVIRWVLS